MLALNSRTSTEKISYQETGNPEKISLTQVLEYAINNNYRDIKKSNSSYDNDLSREISGYSSIETEYVPYWRRLVDRACLNQTWTTTYRVDSTYTDLQGRKNKIVGEFSNSEIAIVEAIDEVKTVTAGTYRTIRIRINDNNSVDTFWIDKLTGDEVYMEGRDTSDTLLLTEELISD